MQKVKKKLKTTVFLLGFGLKKSLFNLFFRFWGFGKIFNLKNNQISKQLEKIQNIFEHNIFILLKEIFHIVTKNNKIFRLRRAKSTDPNHYISNNIIVFHPTGRAYGEEARVRRGGARTHILGKPKCD